MLKGQAMQELTLRRTVELAVDTEQRGQCVYNGLADKFSDDAEMSAIFARLAKDEQMHEAQFKQILETIPEGDEPVQIDADSETYIRATALSMFLKYEVFNNLERVKRSAKATRAGSSVGPVGYRLQLPLASTSDKQAEKRGGKKS